MLKKLIQYNNCSINLDLNNLIIIKIDGINYVYIYSDFGFNIQKREN